MLNTKENLKQIEMDTIEQELLFTKLTPEAAATVEGGVSFKTYTTKGVSTYLNFRSGPGTNYPSIGRWYPGQFYNLQVPAIVKNGFRKLASSLNVWVSTRYIKPA